MPNKIPNKIAKKDEFWSNVIVVLFTIVTITGLIRMLSGQWFEGFVIAMLSLILLKQHIEK